MLVREEEVPVGSVREVYTLLGDDSHGIRHAVAELVAGMLEEQGERALARQGQVGGGARGQWVVGNQRLAGGAQTACACHAHAVPAGG